MSQILHFVILLSILTPSLFHELHHKAFRPWKTSKVHKNRLSLIIQRLRINETTKFGGREKCPMFQSFSSCACEQTCNNPNPICSTCEPGCTCRNGFVRNSLKLCVLPEECPPTKLRRFDLTPSKRLYAAVPVVLPPSNSTFTEISTTTEEPSPPTTTSITTVTTPLPIIPDEMVTVPLLILRNGPTPPSAPPMLQPAPESIDMIGAPAATPPPDFSYGPPGMNASKFALYEDFLKQKRIMRALRHQRNQFAKKMI